MHILLGFIFLNLKILWIFECKQSCNTKQFLIFPQSPWFARGLEELFCILLNYRCISKRLSDCHYLRGWWMCWLTWWAVGNFSTEGCGFWWATWAAAGGKSLSPLAIAPEMIRGGLGWTVPLSHCSASSSFSSYFCLSCMWMLLHNSHSSSFYGRWVSSLGVRLLSRRRRHAAV